MKVPLDDDLDKAYESFNQDHDRLRDALKLSLQEHPTEHGRTPAAACIGSTIMKSKVVKLAAAAVIALPGKRPR